MGSFLMFWKQKTHVSQILFLVAILYCVSSINVLILALGLVHWIHAAYFNPMVLIIFSLVSFAFALVLSAYHFYTFINRRKRKDDHVAIPHAGLRGGMGSFLVFWKQKTHVSQILFLVAILYCVSSINVLILALGLVHWIPAAYHNPMVLIIFSLVSFAFALVLSAYHFFAFINRRKRKDDHVAIPHAAPAGGN